MTLRPGLVLVFRWSHPSIDEILLLLSQDTVLMDWDVVSLETGSRMEFLAEVLLRDGREP